MRIVTEAKVVDKYVTNGKDRNGFDCTWYNVKLGDPETCESQIIGVPQDVYEKTEVDKVNRYAGSFGGLKTKWWKFDKHLGIVK